MEKVDSVGNIFDFFDLDNDNGIDFETAYTMISNFGDVTPGGKQDDLPSKLGLGDCTDTENQFTLNDTKEDHSQPQQYQQNDQQQAFHGQSPLQLQSHISHIQHTQWQQHSDSLERNLEVMNTTYVHEELGWKDSRPQLLSAYESNAIEHFLDSLISRHHAGEKDKQGLLTERDSLPITTTCRPPAVDIPEITVGDSDIPVEIQNDLTKVKKWKHVEIERIRRNQIKKTFAQLISMTKYPRGTGNNKITKPSNDKRVPKHILLGYIVEDIRSILQANERLEILLKDITNLTKEDIAI